MRFSLGIILIAATSLLLLGNPPPAQCYGCAATPCYRGGPSCMGQCSCQWIDDTHGTCG